MEGFKSGEDSGQKYRDELAQKLRDKRNNPEKSSTEARLEAAKVLKKIKDNYSPYSEGYHSSKTKHLAKAETKRIAEKPHDEMEAMKAKEIKNFYIGVYDYQIEKRAKFDKLFEAIHALIDSGMIRDDLVSSHFTGRQFSFRDDVLGAIDSRAYKTDKILDKYGELFENYRKARNEVALRDSLQDIYFDNLKSARRKSGLIAQDLLGISKITGGYSERHPEYAQEREENFKRFIEQYKRTPEEIEEWEKEKEKASEERKKLIEAARLEKEPYIRDYKAKYEAIERQEGDESLDQKEVVRRSYAALAQCIEELSDVYENNKVFIDNYLKKSENADHRTKKFFEFLSKFDGISKYDTVRKILELSLKEDVPMNNYWEALRKLGFRLSDDISMFDFEIITAGRETAESFSRTKPDMILVAPNAAFLPALIGREIVENEKIQKTLKLPKDYNPYLFYPKTKSFYSLMQESGSMGKSPRPDLDAWSDFDLLVDKFNSPDEIQDGKNTILYGNYSYRDYDNRRGTREVLTNISADNLRTVYREMISMADAMERKLKNSEKQQITVTIFDESRYHGSTERALRNMAQGAVKILLKRGVIQSEGQVKCVSSVCPFGGTKPQFPSIHLSSETTGNKVQKKPSEVVQINKILFPFGKSVGKMLAEQMSAEKRLSVEK